jgi:hypothetical protein
LKLPTLVGDFSCYTPPRWLEQFSVVGLRKITMTDQRRGSHTVTRLTVHLVWVTKGCDLGLI